MAQDGTSTRPELVTGWAHGRERIEERGGGRPRQARRIEGRQGAGGEAFRSGAEANRDQGGGDTVGKKVKETGGKILSMLERSSILLP